MRFCDIIYKPQGVNKPSKNQVVQYIKDTMKMNCDELIEGEIERVECKSKNVVIYGEFHPVNNAKGCVILAHGFAQNRHILIPQAKMFQKLGFSTILFDQRAFGESKEKYCTFGVREAEDVVCLIQWVKKRCGEKTEIILFGASMGAVTVMNALNYTEEVKCVIEDSGFASFRKAIPQLYQSMGLDRLDKNVYEELEIETNILGFSLDDNNPLKTISNKSVPILIIHGTSDTVIDVSNAISLYNKCKHPNSRMELFEGREHALAIMDSKRYEDVVEEFIQKI